MSRKKAKYIFFAKVKKFGNGGHILVGKECVNKTALVEVKSQSSWDTEQAKKYLDGYLS